MTPLRRGNHEWLLEVNMLHFKEWLALPYRLGKGVQELRSTRIARSAARQIGSPWKETQPGVLSVFTSSERGFSVKLDVCVDGELIQLLSGANIDIPEEWIQRKLALVLLEENNRYLYGSNRLLPGRRGHTLVHAHCVDSRHVNAGQVAEIGCILIQQIQGLLTRLYAEGLIERPA